MAVKQVNLADLLTAAGTAMAASNLRLAAAGAPALLGEFSLELRFEAEVEVPACDDVPLQLAGVARPNAQMQALLKGQGSNVTVVARYVAAPALQPVPST